MSSRITRVRFAAAASDSTASSDFFAPATAHFGAMADTVTNPALRSRKSRREKTMAASVMRSERRRS
jgi:hypothetical protein